MSNDESERRRDFRFELAAMRYMALYDLIADAAKTFVDDPEMNDMLAKRHDVIRRELTIARKALLAMLPEAESS
jgi:hypothetical protein